MCMAHISPVCFLFLLSIFAISTRSIGVLLSRFIKSHSPGFVKGWNMLKNRVPIILKSKLNVNGHNSNYSALLGSEANECDA
jgi:hypothetical protein